jgi:hypothetical protein
MFYALLQRQYVVSRVVRLLLKLGDQDAAKQDDREGLSMERPSDSAGLLHELYVRLWRR